MEHAKQHATCNDDGATHHDDPQRLLYLEGLKAVHASSDADGAFTAEDQQLATCAADFRYACVEDVEDVEDVGVYGGTATASHILLLTCFCIPGFWYRHASRALHQTTRALQALHAAHSWQQQLAHVDALMHIGVFLVCVVF